MSTRRCFLHDMLHKLKTCLIKNLLLTAARIGRKGCAEPLSCGNFPGNGFRGRSHAFNPDLRLLHIGTVTLFLYYCQFYPYLPPGLTVAGREDETLAAEVLLGGAVSNVDVASTPI